MKAVDIPYQGALLAGVDEVGRGPLAGEVVAAAVILDSDRHIEGLADSKKLSASRREILADEIIAKARGYGLGRASVAEIDEINILQASLLAMKRAAEALTIRPEFVVVDGNRCPDWDLPSCSIVKGDSKVAAISAASILAKVVRDRDMCALDDLWPGYGFSAHKGYGTRQHLTALAQLGPCPAHRISFKPVTACLPKPHQSTDRVT